MNEIGHNLEQTDRQTRRNYGIDALRIISMLMIVAIHVIGFGANIDAQEKGTLRYNVLWLFIVLAFCSVNCYALISGYIGINRKYKLSNLIYLWFQVVFYTLSITLIMKVVHPEAVSKVDIFKAFFPVLSGQYWYFSGYFILFLFVPILNYAIDNIGKVKMGLLLSLLVCFVSVFGLSFDALFGGDVFNLNRGFSAWWLIILYLIGAYFGKHRILVKAKSRWLLVVFVLSTLLTWTAKTVLPLIDDYLFGKDRFVNYTTVTVLISSVSLLLLFSRLKTGKILSKVIAALSPLCFSVYLIHYNILVRDYSITDHFLFFYSVDSTLLLPCVVGSVVGVYLLCSVIDLPRYWLFRLLKLKTRLSNAENGIKKRVYQKFRNLQ